MCNMRFIYFLLSLLAAVSCNATKSSKYLEYADEYFDQVGVLFYDRLLVFGLENLIVDDVTVDANRTFIDGVHIEGDISYSNGQVLEVSPFAVSHDGTRGDVDETGVDLTYHINLRNFTLFTDILANTTLYGELPGSGYLLMINTTIRFTLYINHTTGNNSMFAAPFIIEAPHTSVEPQTQLFLDVARVIRLEYSYKVWWDQIDRWCQSVFIDILSGIVEDCPFPIVPPEGPLPTCIPPSQKKT